MKVGILGGGQLARMLAQAGRPLGMEFMFLCPNPDACAAPFGQHLCAAFDDAAALKRFGDWSDVVTFEFENIPAAVVDDLQRRVPIHPPAIALAVAQDRLREKQTFQSLGIPTPRFSPANSLEQLREAVSDIGLPAIAKTRTQGYDGKGQALLRNEEDLAAAWETLGRVPAIVETLVPFRRELSIIAVRGSAGDTVFYPLIENHHRSGILRLSLSRAGDPLQASAESCVRKLLEHLDYVGILALELFQTDDGLLANEFAPRVHNSGHWTIDGARTSQFENHLRAVGGLPLGDTGLIRPTAMVNLVGELPAAADVRAIPGTVTHLYDKTERPDRKIGHVNLSASADTFDPVFFERLAQLLRLTGEDDLAARIRPPVAP